MTHDLQRLIDLIDQRLAAIPQADWRDDAGWRASQAAQRQILEDLKVSEGASYRDDGLGCALKLAGIRTTCTAGASGVLTNWQAAARRRLQTQRAA